MLTLASYIAGHLASRQRRNPQYSLRSFARDIGLNPGTVSAIMQGRRTIPRARLGLVCDRLALSPRQRAVVTKLWCEEASKASVEAPPLTESVEIDETHYQILAEWEHFAVLSLIRTKGFQEDLVWIAKRLGISMARVKVVLSRLESIGFIGRAADGSLIRTAPPLKTSEGVVSAALQAAHKEELTLAGDALTSVSVDLRDISSMTMAMNPSRLLVASELIKKFRDEMAALCDEDDATEVFQLCIQLFPLTKIEKVGECEDARTTGH